MGKLYKGFWVYALAIPLVIVILDQWSKHAIVKHFKAPANICEINLRPGLTQEVSSVFDFSLVCNPGVSWGMLQFDSSIKRWVITIFAFVMCGVLLYILTGAKDRLTKLSIALIIAGAVGNGIDRARYGAITDFIDFSDIGFRWVFNIADSSITCGVIGLILASFLVKPDKDSAENLT